MHKLHKRPKICGGGREDGDVNRGTTSAKYKTPTSNTALNCTENGTKTKRTHTATHSYILVFINKQRDPHHRGSQQQEHEQDC